MAKYCKAYKLRVTYLDCMECEDKQCKQTRNASMEEHGQTKIASYAQNMESVNLQKGEKMAVTKRYLRLEPEQKVFVVFASKREGYKDNIVLRCNVRECSIRKNTTVYYLTKEKVVLGKEISNHSLIAFRVKMQTLIQDIEGCRLINIQYLQQRRSA